MIYVKDTVHYTRRNDLEPLHIECIWIEIQLKQTQLLFGLFYRPPYSDALYLSTNEDSMVYNHIYTDGSKDDLKVGCAVESDDFSETMRIPDGSTIFTAEAKAIDLVSALIAECETSNTFVIFLDSLSVLKSLDHTSSKNPQNKSYMKSIMIKRNVMTKYTAGSLATLELLAKSKRFTQFTNYKLSITSFKFYQ